MDHFHDLNKHQQNNSKPMFDVMDPSMVRAQFVAKRDSSFSSYLHNQSKIHQNKFTTLQTGQNRATDSDQISIFDAAKYFSGLHDDQKEQQQQQPSKGLNHLASDPPRLSSVSSSIDDNGSNYGGRSSTCTSNNYRARSFHATPTASSEASWNSQTGLLTNPPGSFGVNITKTLSPTSGSTTTSNAAPRWPRISAKWLIPRQKCPCSGKKSVQVEDRTESNTPRMVDLRRGTSSNSSATNYIPSSWYSPRQNGPKNLGTNSTIPLTSPTTNVSAKISDEMKMFANRSEIISTTVNTTATSASVAVGGTSTCKTSNGFTFPILENSPIGVKKMFTVIEDPPRESLEVFQPRNHASPKSQRTSYEDDNVLSDGSSDLFELDSLSTTYLCRDSLDEMVVPTSSLHCSTMKRLGIVCRCNNNISNVDECDDMNDDEPMTPSVAPTECYAPSEASIDWSVTTAEGYDRASLTNFSVSASEVGMYAAMRRESERNNGGGGAGGKGEEKRSRQQFGGKGKGHGSNNNSGGLLGCRCEKVVNVGPGPIKCSAEGAPPIAAKHVSGRTTQQPHHGVGTHINGKWK